MTDDVIPHEIEGWWHITETSTWPDDALDIIGDNSTFIAERADAPDDPIPEPPSYRDKWTGWRPH